MRYTTLLVSFTALWMACVHIELNFAIKLDISTQAHDTVKLTCRLDDSEMTAKKILALQITDKTTDTIVFEKSNGAVFKGPAADNYEAIDFLGMELNKGHPGRDSSNGLSVIIRYNRIVDAGLFHCLIHYMDQYGRFVTHEDSNYLKASDTVTIQSMQREAERIHREVVLKDKEIQKLKSQVATSHVAFSATVNSSSASLVEKSVVHYNVVMLNQGGDYLSNLGSFLTKVPGLYLFHLSVDLDCNGCFVTLQLRVDDRVIGTLYAGDGLLKDHTSITATARLKYGQSVFVYVLKAPWASPLTTGTKNLFGGYLISPDRDTKHH